MCSGELKITKHNKHPALRIIFFIIFDFIKMKYVKKIQWTNSHQKQWDTSYISLDKIYTNVSTHFWHPPVTLHHIRIIKCHKSELQAIMSQFKLFVFLQWCHTSLFNVTIQTYSQFWHQVSFLPRFLNVTIQTYSQSVMSQLWHHVRFLLWFLNVTIQTYCSITVTIVTPCQISALVS